MLTRTKSHFSNASINRTSTAVEHQVRAMAADLYEIGLYDPDAGPTEPVMIPRVWDAGTILKSVAVVATPKSSMGVTSTSGRRGNITSAWSMI